MQKIDIGLFDEELEPIIIRDVTLSDKEALTEVEFEISKPISAVILNLNDHGFCKVRYDNDTLEVLDDK
jgi:hypothetical protein